MMSKELLPRILELKARGMTAAEIGRAVGKSRNAVLGVIFRHKSPELVRAYAAGVRLAAPIRSSRRLRGLIGNPIEGAIGECRMKLSSRDIAIIEDLFRQRIEGKTNAEIAASYGHKKAHHATALATALAVLKAAGVNVPASVTRGETLKREFAEFRAWKAAKSRQTESTLVPRAAEPNGLFRPNGIAAASPVVDARGF